MNKEESMLQKRLVELSGLAYNRGIVVFSDFLNLNELNILHTTPKDMFLSQYKTYGGYDLSERQMAVFLPDALYYEYEYPIQTIEVIPLNKKFSEDLTHRDYLGALMNLGIERCKIGDIIAEDHKALIFVKEEMAEYVTDNLTQIRHTHVKATIGTGFQVDYEPDVYKRQSHGNLNVSQGIQHSCNDFFYEVGYRLGLNNVGDSKLDSDCLLYTSRCV